MSGFYDHGPFWKHKMNLVSTTDLPLFSAGAVYRDENIDLPEPLRQVWKEISKHRGRSEAISLSDISDTLGIEGRAIQIAVNALVVDFGKPIGSTSDRERPGYYIPADETEARRAYQSLVRRAVNILRRAHALRKSPRLTQALGQVELELDGDK